jgi:hypothetical protein
MYEEVPVRCKGARLKRFELWDTLSGDLVGRYDDIVPALSVVFLEMREYGRESPRVTCLELVHTTSCGARTARTHTELTRLALRVIDSDGCLRRCLRKAKLRSNAQT